MVFVSVQNELYLKVFLSGEETENFLGWSRPIKALRPAPLGGRWVTLGWSNGSKVPRPRIHYQAKEVCRHAHKLSSLVKEVRERAALPFLWCRKGVKAVFIL